MAVSTGHCTGTCEKLILATASVVTYLIAEFPDILVGN